MYTKWTEHVEGKEHIDNSVTLPARTKITRTNRTNTNTRFTTSTLSGTCVFIRMNELFPTVVL